MLAATILVSPKLKVNQYQLPAKSKEVYPELSPI